MLKYLCFFFIFLMSNPSFAAGSAQFDTLYSQLLSQYWRPSVSIHDIETTVFDFPAMKRDGSDLIEKIAKSLDQVNLSSISESNDAKAFWINAYNFSALRIVIKAYPVKSITSFKISVIKHPWSKKNIHIGGRKYSLTEIETGVLLKQFDDPRIVFAVSCSAVSCPDQTGEIFTGEKIEQQLTGIIETYFRNPGKGFRLDTEKNTATLAWIMKKDGHLFHGDELGQLEFVKPYLPEAQRVWLASHAVTIDFFEHDWTLNDLARADKR